MGRALALPQKCKSGTQDWCVTEVRASRRETGQKCDTATSACISGASQSVTKVVNRRVPSHGAAGTLVIDNVGNAAVPVQKHAERVHEGCFKGAGADNPGRDRHVVVAEKAVHPDAPRVMGLDGGCDAVPGGRREREGEKTGEEEGGGVGGRERGERRHPPYGRPHVPNVRVS